MKQMERIVYTAEAASVSKGLDRDASKTLVGRLLAVDDPQAPSFAEDAPPGLQTARAVAAKQTAVQRYTSLHPTARPLSTEEANSLRAKVYAAMKAAFSKQVVSFLDSDKTLEGRAHVHAYGIDQLQVVREVFAEFHAGRAEAV